MIKKAQNSKVIFRTQHLLFILVLSFCAGFLLVFSRNEFLFLEALGIIFLYIFFLYLAIYVSLHIVSDIKKRFLQNYIKTGVLIISIFLTLFVIFTVWIRFEIKTSCQDAKRQYGGTCTKALSLLLEDEHRSYRSRNNAVFALGQLGDRRALPVLKKYYTGNIPQREPLDNVISQYELKKAVKLTSEEKNILAIFWRYGIE